MRKLQLRHWLSVGQLRATQSWEFARSGLRSRRSYGDRAGERLQAQHGQQLQQQQQP